MEKWPSPYWQRSGACFFHVPILFEAYVEWKVGCKGNYSCVPRLKVQGKAQGRYSAKPTNSRREEPQRAPRGRGQSVCPGYLSLCVFVS
jgi:hypothetical protein|uniref:Uncharacterized protein n=1 Tax=Picea glauca TaxID=3330 RepID=A0A101M4F6_PICGL|nr:hypothetical protein ABT39_MTgene775 [Picea glauca]QHR90494.1 hypothetical protein Q903MT_gene4518 [Picea sitchensis]